MYILKNMFNIQRDDNFHAYLDEQSSFITFHEQLIDVRQNDCA